MEQCNVRKSVFVTWTIGLSSRSCDKMQHYGSTVHQNETSYEQENIAQHTWSLEPINIALSGGIEHSTKEAVRFELSPSVIADGRRRHFVASRGNPSPWLWTRRPGLKAPSIDNVLAVVAQSVLGDLRRVIVTVRVPLTRHGHVCSIQYDGTDTHVLSPWCHHGKSH